MMKWILFVGTAWEIAGPAAADQASREAAMIALADAAAHAGLCSASDLTVDPDTVGAIVLAANLVDSEIEALSVLTKTTAEQLADTPDDVICRDAIERYGADGTVVKGLLVPK